MYSGSRVSPARCNEAPSAALLQERYTNAFLGYGPEDDRFFSLELTYNYGKESYDLGSGFGHFALGVPDVYKTVDSIKSAGERLSFVTCCHPSGSFRYLHS